MGGLDIAAIVVALIGLAGGVYATAATKRQDREIAELRVPQELQIGYYAELLKERRRHYLELWTVMRDLPKYPRREPLHYAQLNELAEKFRDWYFDGGGLFLSVQARERYFDLQDGLKVLLQKQRGEWSLPVTTDDDPDASRDYLGRNPGWVAPPELRTIIRAEVTTTGITTPIPDDVIENLRMLGSLLRSQLTDDVATRRLSYFDPANQRPGADE